MCISYLLLIPFPYSNRKLAVKQRWEKDRAQLGARWAWLCHQILTLNQKLYQLDSRTQAQDPKETVQLTPHNPPPSPLNLPNCVCGLQNGHSDHKIPGGQPPQRGNGSTLLSKPPLGGKVNGGVTCSCQFRQMLLSNQSLMMSHPLQVGDLVGCSFPVLVMDEANQVSARTRGTHRAPKRKLVRMKEKRHERRRKRKGSGCSTVDESYHPHLSQEGGKGKGRGGRGGEKGKGREGGRKERMIICVGESGSSYIFLIY